MTTKRLPLVPLCARIPWTRVDLPAMEAIDRDAFYDHWDADRLQRFLERPRSQAVLARHLGRPVGFILYTGERKLLRVERMAVDADRRRAGVGRFMLDELRRRLSHSRRGLIELAVPEVYLGAQLFLRSCGFLATGEVRPGGGDGYDLFVFVGD